MTAGARTKVEFRVKSSVRTPIHIIGRILIKRFGETAPQKHGERFAEESRFRDGPGQSLDTSLVIPTLAIDDYVLQQEIDRIDAIKLDIEGAEADALTGMRKAIETFSPALFLEVHPRQLEEFGKTAQEVLRPLFDLGYSGWRIPDHRAAPSGSESTLLPLSSKDLSITKNEMILLKRER